MLFCDFCINIFTILKIYIVLNPIIVTRFPLCFLPPSLSFCSVTLLRLGVVLSPSVIIHSDANNSLILLAKTPRVPVLALCHQKDINIYPLLLHRVNFLLCFSVQANTTLSDKDTWIHHWSLCSTSLIWKCGGAYLDLCRVLKSSACRLFIRAHWK